MIMKSSLHMKKLLPILFLFLLSINSRAESFANLKSGLALEGYDPVSYFDTTLAASEKPKMGNAKFQIQHDGATYYFVNETQKAMFHKDPKHYVPAYGGWCAYAVADSKSKVEVDVRNFLIQDGRLLLFYKDFFRNTRKTWSKDSSTYLVKADANWPEVKSKEP